MSDKKYSLGQAIDQIIEALEALDPNARQTAIEAARSHLDLQPIAGIPITPLQSTPANSNTLHASSVPHLKTPAKKIDIRSLKEEKRPASARQMACVVAYYLQELAPDAEKKETVTNGDIEKYFKQAGFKLPKALEQVLLDAKSSGYFESAGRGEYKLNAVGYNLVAHSLPHSKGE